VIIEPIQAEGGIREPPDGFFAALRARCSEDRHGADLDEVQTGVGRTGTFFGYQRTGVTPDVISLAKGARRRRADRRDGGLRRGWRRALRPGRTLRPSAAIRWPPPPRAP